jgi:hypothetical protein
VRRTGCLLPRLERVQHFGTDRELLARLGGFQVVYLLTYDSALDLELVVQPVNIVPFEGKCFADPQTQTAAQKGHCSERLPKVPHKPLKLFNGQTARSVGPGDVFLPCVSSQAMVLRSGVSLGHSTLGTGLAINYFRLPRTEWITIAGKGPCWTRRCCRR